MPAPIAAQALANSLRTTLRQAELDHEAFQRPMSLCELPKCRATCCHDGVVLDPIEVAMLEEQLREQASILFGYGLDKPTHWFESDFKGHPKTATRPAQAHELAVDFPDHFSQTRCVFLDDHHRCAWQRLALDLGEAPWTYKPVSCWMHPVTLISATEQRPPYLTIAGDADNPEDFASATPCGRVCPEGSPAKDVLNRELTLLGQIAGRDFMAELAHPWPSRA